MSGEVKQDMTLVNKRADANEKMGHIFTVCGKKTAEVRSSAAATSARSPSWSRPRRATPCP